MHDTLRCPGCGADLTLPNLPTGQDVQCPRCQTIFEPKRAATNAPLPLRKRPILLDESDDDWPRDPRSLVRPDPLIGQWKAVVAGVALASSVLSYGMQAYLDYEHGRFLKQIQEGGFQAEFPGLFTERMARWARLFHEGTFWPAVVFFLIWIYQASRNLKLLQSAGMLHTPIMSVVYFFVPVMNLYRPYFVMQEIWRGSDPHAVGNSLTWIDAPKGAVVRSWWFFFLAALVLRVASRQLESHVNWESLGTIALMSCLSHLCMVVAGVLLIVIVSAVAIRQRERYARLYAD